MKAGVFFAGLAVIATTLLSVETVPANAQDKKPYTIYLSNNFVGNDWRQQMLRSADIAVKKPPLAGRVDLKVEVVETTVQAQINSLNNIIRNKPDAIVIDAGSGEALNPTIEKACKAGIVVIAFDQIVSAPCAYTMESDWGRAPRVEAEWLVKKLGGKGKILVDRGLAGAPISAQLQGGFEEVIKKYPGIEVVGYFNGDYALGPEQAGVASLLAAHPQIDPSRIGAQGRGNQGAAGCRASDRSHHRQPFQPDDDDLYSDPGCPVHPCTQPCLSVGRGLEACGRDTRRQEAGGEEDPAAQCLPHHRSGPVGIVSRCDHAEDRGWQECLSGHGAGTVSPGQPGLG